MTILAFKFYLPIDFHFLWALFTTFGVEMMLDQILLESFQNKAKCKKGSFRKDTVRKLVYKFASISF